MTHDDLKREKMEDMRQDMLEEQYKNSRMLHDIEYAIDEYNSIETLAVALEGLEKHLASVGYDLTRKEVLELLEDI